VNIPAWSPAVQLAALGATSSLVMTLGWLWQRRHGNAGIVDVLWAAGLAAGAVLIAVTGSGAILPRALLALLGAAWALRLAAHLWSRVRGEAEDGRYRHLRRHWQGHQGKFFLFFQFQGLLVVLFALPFAAVAANPSASMNAWCALGIAIWLGAVGGEAVADRQLARFRAREQSRGRTCRDGLWRYSRHPNYFFEWLHWFAYVALAASSPHWWLAASGPVLMYVFLRWISGIPFTEAQALRTRGEDYRDYQRRTPMLFPWFPGRTDAARNSR
jgi:steroid 5-alpha reductase family enzyme